MSYDQLKRRFEQEADIYNYRLSDYEFFEILKKIEPIPHEERTKVKWQVIIKEITGCLFRINDGYDFSDINALHQEIIDILNRDGNS